MKTVDLGTPEGVVAAIRSHDHAIAALAGGMAAVGYAVKVLAATHPDLSLLARAWHAPKDGEIERHLNSTWTGNNPAFRDGFTAGIAAVESMIEAAWKAQAAEDE